MIIAVGSWRGTGSTTTALLLASCLAMRNDVQTWLVEADPAGGALAGRMQLAAHTIGGLERVAFPAERVAPREAFDAVVHRAARLSVITAPSDPFRAHACHQPRLPWVASLRDLADNVVIDVGRLRGGAPVWPILAMVDKILIVTSPEVSAAVSTSEWLRADGRVSPADPGLLPDKTGLLFVDSPGSVPFPQSMLRTELGDQFAAWFPWEAAAVDLMHRGALPDDRRLRRSTLMGAAMQLALDITIESNSETVSRERVDA